MKLYEITTIEGETIEAAVRLQEAAKILERSAKCLYQDALYERIVKERYRITPVDYVISRKKDAELLKEYDRVRRKILKTKKTEEYISRERN